MSAVSTAGSFSLEVLCDRAGLERVAEEWRVLPQALANPLLSPEWSTSSLPAMHGEARTLTLRRNGVLAALAPLTRTRRAGFARLEILGSRDLAEPSSLLYRDADALSALCDRLVSEGLPIILNRMPADDALLAEFSRATRGRGRLFLRPARAAPVVQFPRDFSTWEATLSARRRQDYRRARRKLEESGPVTFDLRIPSSTTVRAELEEAMRVEAAGWKSERGSALSRNEKLGGFFHELAARLASRGELRICFLRVGGVAIATQIGIEHAHRWWILKIGYDEQWSDYSPGIQLMWDVVRHAGEARLDGVEMLGSAEEWISIWARATREYRTLVFYPWNLRGVGALVADAASAAWQRLWRKR